MTNPFTTIIRDLRATTPSYPLTESQAKSVAERQAAKFLELLGIREAPVDVSLIAELPRMEVVVRSTRELGGLSGFSEWHGGRWQIGVNRDDSSTRRRFTLAHEFKHVLDHPFMRVLYLDAWGRTDDQRVENVCDYFAACLLMPRPWVKRAWATLSQDQTELAAYFRVSPAAMARRLADLKLTEPTQRHGHESVARYFRRATPLTIAA
ncbi:ImmA/IrrE family metallo-endopeptidase [Amycolatopsis tolypomycina]|uniref:ImmA/IrrE family metallo-endopeptidase n=1 Tax=Amycolatopsis tolypomycina TaxID=208445 RepID=UPI0033BE040F